MTDYISREMTIDAICRLCNANFEEDPCEPSECEMMSLLRKIPAADVRPVLCRDCVHFSEVMYGGTQFEYGYCDRWADGAKMNPDDFCSRAEKREES